MDTMPNKSDFRITDNDQLNDACHLDNIGFQYETASNNGGFIEEQSENSNVFDPNLDVDHVSYICGSDVLIGASETIETEISPLEIVSTNNISNSISDSVQDSTHDPDFVIMCAPSMEETVDIISVSAVTNLVTLVDDSIIGDPSQQSEDTFSIPKSKRVKQTTVKLKKPPNQVKNSKQRKSRKRNLLKPTCSICALEFTNKATFKAHMLIHLEGQGAGTKRGRKPHFDKNSKPTCSICSVKFTNTASLKTHMLIHSGERPFQCDLCEKTFARNTVLKIHRRLHTGEKPYKCKLCSSGFVTKEALARHAIKDHQVETDADSRKEKPSYKCEVCGKCLCSKYSLQSHMNIHRQNDDAKSGVECKICKKKFTCRYTLQRHVFEKHNLRGIITCSVCEMSFSSKWEHSKHQDIHATSQKFQCDLCTKTFSKKFQLLYHLQVHEAERAVHFSCYLCKKEFGSRETFLEHIRCYVDREMQIYSCPQCHISFSDARQLKLHLNEKHKLPVISDLNYCDICKLSSPDANSYYEHLFEKHDYVDILCNECGCYFKSRRQYDEHFTAHFL